MGYLPTQDQDDWIFPTTFLCLWTKKQLINFLPTLTKQARKWSIKHCDKWVFIDYVSRQIGQQVMGS